ncbi:hypothetical protein D9619_012462 [Psilocybe cf. subviscida]|uniref:Uncharacterized protein n=1 Tax=Psilocybe cf. subviscida TaxID=2480587 RepID=A0A8H5ARK0_9AGAR|nr:hypothetical protein D9619_012462 [Psilocybe cf. subviscida]
MLEHLLSAEDAGLVIPFYNSRSCLHMETRPSGKMSGRDNDISTFLGGSSPSSGEKSIYPSKERARYESLGRTPSLDTSWSSSPDESTAILRQSLRKSRPARVVWLGTPHTATERDARDSFVGLSSQTFDHPFPSSLYRTVPASSGLWELAADRHGWIPSPSFHPWSTAPEDDSTYSSPEESTSKYKSTSADIDNLAFRLSGIRVGPPPAHISTDRRRTCANRIFPQGPHEEKNPTLFLQRITSDKSIQILMLGEGSQLSMTITLAFMRSSFKGVWSSSYTHGTRRFSKVHIENLVKVQRQKVGSLEWSPRYKNASTTHLQDEDIPRLSLEIDTRELSAAAARYVDVPMHVLWFPFPWVMATTDILLRDLISSAATVQRTLAGGGVLIIGLTLYQPYTRFYGDLDQLVQYAQWLGYEHYAEHDFMKTTCCQFGYQHWWSGIDGGMPPVHVKVINPSSTHIFVMR